MRLAFTEKPPSLFFHNRWRETRIDFNKAGSAYFTEAFALPVLEDANSIQVTIMQVLRLIIAKHLDSKTAGLLLDGLQTASLNLKDTRFEPYNQQDVVIEPPQRSRQSARTTRLASLRIRARPIRRRPNPGRRSQGPASRRNRSIHNRHTRKRRPLKRRQE